jgi:hypothetical protein
LSDNPFISALIIIIVTIQVSITVLATGFATDFFAVEGGEEFNVPIPKTAKMEKVEKTESSWRREAVIAREGPIVAPPTPPPSSAKRPRPKLEEDIGFEVIDRRAIADTSSDGDEDDEDQLRNRRRRIQQTGQSEKSANSGKRGGIRGFFRRLFGR